MHRGVDRTTMWYRWSGAPFLTTVKAFLPRDPDNQFSVRRLGSQQDSGSAAVPSRTTHGPVSERDWFSVGGGESGWIAVDPKDSNIVYAGDTNGTLVRFDKRTAQAHNITPWRCDRSAWNFRSENIDSHGLRRWCFRRPSLERSTSDRNTCSKTVDGGLTWREVSPI